MIKKAFEPEYVASIGDGTAPANEPMLRINPLFLRSNHYVSPIYVGIDSAITPHPAIKRGTTIFVTRKVAFMLIWTISCISWRSVSLKSTGMSCDLPTLLTKNCEMSWNIKRVDIRELTKYTNIKVLDDRLEFGIGMLLGL